VEPATLEKLTAIRRRATSLLLVFAAAFIFLSLVSYTSRDFAGSYWPAGAAQNLCGRAGALLAHGLLTYFGYVAYLAVILAVAFAARCLTKRDLLEAWLGVFGAVIMLLSAAAAAQLIGPRTSNIPGSGGLVGIAVSGVFLDYFGLTGSWLLTVLLFALGGLLLSADRLVEWAITQGNTRLRAWLEQRRGRSGAAVVASQNIRVGGASASAAAAPRLAVIAPRQAAVPRAATTPVAAATTGAAAGVLTEHGRNASTAAEQHGQDASATAAVSDNKQPEQPAKTTPPAPIPIRSVTTKQNVIDRIAKVPAAVAGGDYQLPPFSLLDTPPPFDQHALEALIHENSAVIERSLAEFGIGAQVVGIERGPSVTRYEIALAPGIKVNRITSLSDDLAMAVKASSVRVVAPIPGKSTAGVEVPNAIKEIVSLSELLVCDEFLARKDKLILPILLGKNASGTPIFSDLTRMPHLLIAGATGSGKSVCLNSIIVTTLMLHRPEDVRMILVDPKMVDLGMFERVPHLLTPVVTDMKMAPHVLEWATKQMDERYDWLARVGVRHITQYNKLGAAGIREKLGDDYDEDELPDHMPYIVVIVDELADMMMVASKEVELYITRLAQKSRAVGIHIILATQRPSVDVITGLIKSNLPTRISFQVASKVDSRTILDRNGAEKLLGSGDLLFIPPGTSEMVRVQGTYCSDAEIRKVVDFAKKQAEPAYLMSVKQLGGRADADEPDEEYGPDELYDPACRIVLESRRGSVSLLQRKLEIGYGRAARLVDMMAAEGIVGGYKGSKAREVAMTLDEWEEKRGIPPEERTSAKGGPDPADKYDDIPDDDEAEDEENG